ncbi:PREDICTED: fetal and adult testis-expressed transcript protein [Chrysochloris asiatica]|uniref:Fetal and adult testis-expressed transcript protein n=1 Tax=Chrysochloris asiatica TaxID=185453 RepID=A0A9B0U0N6_CHRAS|nr:PREDICTED: fetal and adult testis-expressed transcript protein [Chrysochloris asiatica]
MAGGPPNLKKEMEMSMAEELHPGGQVQGQEHLVMRESLNRGSQSLGSASQQRQNLEPKVAGSNASTQTGDVNASGAKKAGSRTSRKEAQGDAQEHLGSTWFPYNRNTNQLKPSVFLFVGSLNTDLIAGIGLEELNGLEMEVMRRQLNMITGRLRDLEEQGATWSRRETLIFTMLVSVCVANLWLWMRR